MDLADLHTLLDPGRYQPRRVLGRGMAGTVLLAHDVSSGQPVAIKLITTREPELRSRLGREVELLRSLRHAALVPLLDAALDKDPPFLVFPYYAGGDLERLVAEAPLPVERVLELARPLAGALAEVHRAGALHRDIKPANILLDAAGHPALADLGLGRAETSQTLTATGTIMGTPRYLPPDVISGLRPPDEASDQYALAVTLSELLLGRPSDWSLGKPLFLPEALEAIPAPVLRATLRRGIRSQAEYRFPDMDAFLASLDATPAPREAPAFAGATATLSPDATETVFPDTPAPVAPKAADPVARELQEEPPVPAAPSRERGSALGRVLPGVVALGLVAAAGSWLLRPPPPAPPPLPPETAELTGAPFEDFARLAPGGALEVRLREPVELRWSEGEAWAYATPGARMVPLPTSLPGELALLWRQGDREGRRRFSLGRLLEPALVPLAPGARIDLLHEHRAGVSEGLVAALDAYRLLVAVGPTVLQSAAPAPLRRRVADALEEGEALELSLGRAVVPRIPAGRPGYRGVNTPRGPEPPLVVLAPEDLEQPGGVRARIDMGARGEWPAWRLKPPYRGPKVMDPTWRRVKQRVLWTWPHLSVPPEAVVRVTVLYAGEGTGFRLRIGLDPREDRSSGALPLAGSAPGAAMFHLGAANGPSHHRHALWRLDGDFRAADLPAEGTSLEIRMEVLGEDPQAFVDVHSIEIRQISNQAADSN